MPRSASLAIAVAAAAFASGLRAEGLAPLSPEFALSNMPRAFGASCMGVARAADGRFVAVIGSSEFQGTAMRHLRLFNADGSPLSEELHGQEGGPHGGVAMDPGGDFVAVNNLHRTGVSSTIEAQRYDASGGHLGSVQVNNNTTYGQGSTAVAVHADGSFVVGWGGPDGGSAYPQVDMGVFARLFDAAGTPKGDAFRVNDITAGQQSGPKIGMDAEGDFVVIWTEHNATRLKGQRYDRHGTPLGGNQLLTDSGVQGVPQIGMATDGDFVVAWTQSDGVGTVPSSGIRARRYDALGQPLGGSFRVNETTAGQQVTPCIAAGRDGHYAIVWTNSLEQEGYGRIMGRSYAGNGGPTGGEVLLSTGSSTDRYTEPSIAADRFGNFVVTWSRQHGSVHGRLFGTDLSPDHFTFQARRGVDPLRMTRSAPLVIAGIAEAEVAVSGHPSAMYSVNGAALTAVPGTIRSGDTLQAAVESPPMGGAAHLRTIEISVGYHTATFSVQTESDRRPAPFAFAPVTRASAGVPVTSAAVIPAGYTVMLRAEISGHSTCRLRVDNQPLARRAELVPGNALRLRMVAPVEAGTSRTCNVTLGEAASSFTATTAP